MKKKLIIAQLESDLQSAEVGMNKRDKQIAELKNESEELRQMLKNIKTMAEAGIYVK